MIVINLLPPSARRRRSGFEMPPKMVMAACGGVVGLLAICVATSFILGLMASRDLAAAKAELTSLAPQQAEAIKLKNMRDSLNARAKLVQDLVDGRISWAEMLSAVADLVPDEIWLTELRLDQKEETIPAKNRNDTPKVVVKRALVIRGVAVAPEAAGELNSVAVFMERLREDKAFSEHFPTVQQDGPIEWDPDLGQSMFQLRCAMREGA